VFHYVFMCLLPGKAIFEIIYTVSERMLNPTHSLCLVFSVFVFSVV